MIPIIVKGLGYSQSNRPLLFPNFMSKWEGKQKTGPKLVENLVWLRISTHASKCKPMWKNTTKLAPGRSTWATIGWKSDAIECQTAYIGHNNISFRKVKFAENVTAQKLSDLQFYQKRSKVLDLVTRFYHVIPMYCSLATARARKCDKTYLGCPLCR